MRSTSPFPAIAAACWSCFISFGTTAPFVDIRMSGTFVEQFHPHGLARSETYLSALRTDLENGKYVQFRNAIEKILEYGVTIEQEVFLG